MLFFKNSNDAPFHRINYSLDFFQQASEEVLDNRGRLFRLAIESKNAKSLTFFFSEYKIPQGGCFFAYDNDKQYIKGMFTSLNMRPDGKFGIAEVKGSKTILEYYAPKGTNNDVSIVLEAIDYEFNFTKEDFDAIPKSTPTNKEGAAVMH